MWPLVIMSNTPALESEEPGTALPCPPSGFASSPEALPPGSAEDPTPSAPGVLPTAAPAVHLRAERQGARAASLLSVSASSDLEQPAPGAMGAGLCPPPSADSRVSTPLVDPARHQTAQTGQGAAHPAWSVSGGAALVGHPVGPAPSQSRGHSRVLAQHREPGRHNPPWDLDMQVLAGGWKALPHMGALTGAGFRAARSGSLAPPETRCVLPAPPRGHDVVLRIAVTRLRALSPQGEIS